ncbi:TetR/AcrR family transcriptional regulator [Microbacterium sp. G2-8]|uniref:TetR/AcrR family transcriptional regulator n=1 Tax=Microbacterium sp. G2-8 TaxID=2842454 RepID=UPI001C8B0613|nr:TetR/AcrR family transcriptional regulator [Microbacterium sp. G2-8]
MSPRVGPSGPLSRERIVDAAIGLADDGGLEAVTMSRVAGQLRTGAMSLYRHVSDKDDLVAAMVERVTTDFAYPDRAGLDWRGCMHALAEQDRASFSAHPWMLAATATVTPPFGTASLAAMEWALDVLEDAGISGADAARGVMTINHYVHGSARIALGESSAAGSDPGAAWRERLHDVELSALPHLRQLIAAPAPAADRNWFADGLDLILDGLERRVGR